MLVLGLGTQPYTQPCVSFCAPHTLTRSYWSKPRRNMVSIVRYHIHFIIYRKHCYVSWEEKNLKCSRSLEAFCHAFNFRVGGVKSYLRQRVSLFSLSGDQPAGSWLQRSSVLPSRCLLVTTDIGRVSHPACSHSSDVAEQVQSMIYQPGQRVNRSILAEMELKAKLKTERNNSESEL